MTNNNSRGELGGHLSGITYGRIVRHIFVAMYGPNGAGKTSWASHAPDPVFADFESGTEQLNVPRLPKPKTLGEFRNIISGLTNQEHPFKTLVIDPLDGVENLIWQQVRSEDPMKPKSIEQAFGGYGKGYVRALEIWRGLLNDLTWLVTKMHVVLIANCAIKRFDDPKLPSAYDRYILQLNSLAAGAVRQYVDALLFVSFDEKVRELSKTTGKGIGDGTRVVYSEHRPAFDAKNRFNLPFEMELEWRAFAECVKHFYFGDSGSQQQKGGAELSATAPHSQAEKEPDENETTGQTPTL
jgi:hypothetical protein